MRCVLRKPLLYSLLGFKCLRPPLLSILAVLEERLSVLDEIESFWERGRRIPFNVSLEGAFGLDFVTFL